MNCRNLIIFAFVMLLAESVYVAGARYDAFGLLELDFDPLSDIPAHATPSIVLHPVEVEIEDPYAQLPYLPDLYDRSRIWYPDTAPQKIAQEKVDLENYKILLENEYRLALKAMAENGASELDIFRLKENYTLRKSSAACDFYGERHKNLMRLFNRKSSP